MTASWRRVLALLHAALVGAAMPPAASAAPQAWRALLQPSAWSGGGCPQLAPAPQPLEIALDGEPTHLLIGYFGGDVRLLPLSAGAVRTEEGDRLSVALGAERIDLRGDLVIPLPDCIAREVRLEQVVAIDAAATLQVLRHRARLLDRIDAEVRTARDAGRVDRSLAQAQAIERDAQVALAPGDPVRTRARLRVAEELSWAGRFEEAIATIDAALAEPERRLPDGDYKVISALEYRAHALSHSRRLDEGRRAQERVVELARTNFGAGHQETLAQITSLADMMKGSGADFVAEAVRMQERNYAAQLELLGPLHLDVARSSAILQDLLYHNGEFTRMQMLAGEQYAALRAAQGELHPRTLRALNDYGTALLFSGQVEEGLRVLQQADRGLDEVVRGATNDLLNRKQRLHAALVASGRYAEAIRFGEDLAQRATSAELPAIRTNTLVRLASIHSELGQCDRAMGAIEAAIEDLAARRGPSHVITLAARRVRARCLAALGEVTAGLNEQQDIARAVISHHGPNHPLVPAVALDRARLLAGIDPALALAELASAIASAQAAVGPDHPSALALELLAAEINPARSGPELRALLERARRILGPAHPWVLPLQTRLALLLVQQRDWRNAEVLIDGYVAAVEAERARLDAGRPERQGLLSDRALPYKVGVTVKLALGKRDAAFQLAERAKARGLLDALALRRAADYAGLSSEQSARLRNAEGRVQAIDDRLASEAMAAEARANLQIERTAALADVARVRAALASENPRYARLAEVQILDADQARRIVPAAAALISYVIAGERLIALVVRADGPLAALDLGTWAPIEQQVLALRRAMSSASEADAAAARAATTAAAQALAHRLLEPLRPMLAGTRRWLIAPDGALATLPFDLLPDAKGRPLAERAAISYTQSASVLALTTRLPGRGNGNKRVLAFGDPDLQSLAYEGQSGTGPKVRAALALDLARPVVATPLLERLPGSRAEVEAVARIDAASTDVLLGSDATEARLRRLDAEGGLQQYRYLLFATHGLLNADVPLLSAIVLGREGAADPNDGLVTALEWTGLRLSSELTVLSACDTGLGRDMPGEGIMGLPYALFVAGNRQTLLTLWPVPDRSTARFVARFFEWLAQGLAAHEALMRTKREFVRDRPGSERVWAGFVLYGV